MYVNATAGTTVYGAFDPINAIADICEKYNMWLHVDVRPYFKVTKYREQHEHETSTNVNTCYLCRVPGEEVC